MSITPFVRLIDDDAEYLESEVFLLRKLKYNVIAYEGAVDFLQNGDLESPGCAIVDMKMPEIDGSKLISIFAERKVKLPVICLTGHGDIQMAIHSFKNGAFDFLQKPVDSKVLVNSIEKAFELSLANYESKEKLKKAREKFELLSPREKDVCNLLIKGLLNKQIAFELGVSEHTVKVHRASARKKLDIRTPVEFVQMMMEVGAVP